MELETTTDRMNKFVEYGASLSLSFHTNRLFNALLSSAAHCRRRFQQSSENRKKEMKSWSTGEMEEGAESGVKTWILAFLFCRGQP